MGSRAHVRGASSFNALRESHILDNFKSFNNQFGTFEDAHSCNGFLECLGILEPLTKLADARVDFLSSASKDVVVVLKNLRHFLQIVMDHADSHSMHVLREVALEGSLLLMPEVAEHMPFQSASASEVGESLEFPFNKVRKDCCNRCYHDTTYVSVE